MSRRKQRKPQQLISDCEGPSASENGDASEEDHPQVCAKCCAQFTDPAEFLAHQNACSTEPPVMVIIGGQENPNNSNASSEPRPEGHSSPQVMDTENSNPPESGSSGPTDPTWGPERRGEETSGHFLVAATGTAAGGGGGLILASPKLGATPLPPESTPAPPPPPPPPPPPGVGSGHLNIPLILEELRVLQQRQIHQMQMTEQICRQVLLLGSLGQSVGAPASPSELPGTGTASSTKPLLPLFSPIKPVQTGKTLAPSSSSSSSSGAETPKQAFFHLYHPLGAQHPFSAGGVGRNHKPAPAPSPALPGSADQLIASPHLAFPGTTGLLAAQCLGAARGLEATASPGLLKPKNGSGELGYGEVMGPLEKPGGRHKCRFCAKVFGSDSALQIHLRSHTGERPYKCNVCGNRFTTRGNLKVHFHRHREKYPHVQMNPHPVPEHLDYVITSSGLPYGMSVPPEKAEEEAATPSGGMERKPLVASTTALSATESLTLLSTGAGTATAPGLPAFNKFVLMKAVEPKSKVDENTPPGSEGSAISGVAESGTATRMQLSKLVTSLPSWALLTNHFKSTGSFPFPYVLEPLGASPSETSKLQQLVEKIDRQGAVAVASTPSGAPTTSAPAPSSSASSGPNQCVICLRVLSCPRALRLHYGQHGGERPFKCKVCGRAFSTRGNLRAHFVGHKASPAARAQNSCPICQKKFTNAVTLQQHVRMHLGGQIPNGGTTLPEGGGAAQENGSEQSAVSVVGSFPQQQSQQPSLEEEISEEEDEDEEEEEDVTDEDSLAGRGSESGGEKAISVRGDSEEASGAEEEVGSMAAAATAGKEIDSNEKANQQSSLPPPPPPPDCLDQPQPMEQGSSDVSGGMEEVGKPERSSSPETPLNPEREGTGTPLVEELSLQEAGRKEPGESSGRKTCEVCGQTFPIQAALEEHQKTHPKEGPLFTCIFCRQGFLERATLKKHMLLAHHQVQPFAPHGPQNIAALSLVPGCSPSVTSPGLSPFPRKDDPTIP
ncbi:sal-like protein 2 isoform X2 [Ictidomys tridecemlineatus]|uniref:Sal-like protein 2 n=1 Tax=Ictidomys tridecemlineatus TaxID=43179 RepID=I3N315_ICTTR|nr:sal-like protein 2 isoform X2 [Ictidomys tridecemlineatus]KAG3260861.1 spalt like transcription factor 2, transcript variant X2 [Ictidomys tridecemlineatus]